MGKALTLAGAKARHAAEQRGAWFEYKYGGRFLVRYHRNPDYNRRREQFLREEREALQLRDDEVIPVDARNRATARAMYGTLLADWAEIHADEAGTPAEFTEANVVELLLTDLDLAQEIYAFAEKRDNYHREQSEARARD